jgi:hypothetical protein
MDVEEFVQQTIMQISQGVVAAAKALASQGVVVNPRYLSSCGVKVRSLSIAHPKNR